MPKANNITKKGSQPCKPPWRGTLYLGSLAKKKKIEPEVDQDVRSNFQFSRNIGIVEHVKHHHRHAVSHI